MIVQYVEKKSLANRGAHNQAEDRAVEGILLVGTKAVLEYYGNESPYGEDFIQIFPAVHKGERGWLQRETWCAAANYSAYGVDEEILSFEAGVKMFLERGIFSFPLPEKKSETATA